MAAKRKHGAMLAPDDEPPVDPSDELNFVCLGGGNEVGRSCHIIQYKGKTVMVSTRAPSTIETYTLTLGLQSWTRACMLPTTVSLRYLSLTSLISPP